MESIRAENYDFPINVMAYASEAPTEDNVAQLLKRIADLEKRNADLEKRNIELQKEPAELRKIVSGVIGELKEVKDMAAGSQADAQFVRNQAAKLQYEIKSLKKPQRTSARRRELGDAQTKARELEEELQTVRGQNAELQEKVQAVQHECDYWQEQWVNTQADAYTKQNTIEQLEATIAALNTVSGSQQSVLTPPADPTYGNTGLQLNMGGDFQAPLQTQGAQAAQTTQLDGVVGGLAVPNQQGAYNYQQAYMPAGQDLWQGPFNFDFQP